MDFVIDQPSKIIIFVKLLQAASQIKNDISFHLSPSGMFILQNQYQLDQLQTMGKQTFIGYLSQEFFGSIRNNQQLKDLDNYQQKDFIFDLQVDNLLKIVKGVKNQVKQISISVGYKIQEGRVSKSKVIQNVVNIVVFIITFQQGQTELQYESKFQSSNEQLDVLVRTMIKQCNQQISYKSSINDPYNLMNISSHLITDITKHNKNQSIQIIFHDEFIEISPNLNKNNLFIVVNKAQLGCYSHQLMQSKYKKLSQILIDPNFYLPLSHLSKCVDSGEFKIFLGREIKNDMCKISLEYCSANNYLFITKSTSILSLLQEQDCMPFVKTERIIEQKVRDDEFQEEIQDQSIMDIFYKILEQQNKQKDLAQELINPQKKLKPNEV